MKICHFITTLARGGAEHQLLRLLTSFEEESLNHEICYIGQEHHMREEFEAAGIPVTNLAGSSKSDFVSVARRLRRFLQDGEFDILHNHQVHPGVIGRIVAKTVDLDGVITAHQNVSFNYDYATRLAEITTRPLDDITVGVSEGVTQSFDTNVVEKAVNRWCDWRTIPNTIDVNQFNEEVTDTDEKTVYEQWDIEPTSVIFLNVGRYAEQKNQRRLLKAMDTLVSERPDVHLLIVGWGELEDELTSLTEELGIEDSVTITGKVSDMAPLYSAADVFVLPSLYEGLSVASVEAMAAELPIIGTNVPGINEVVEDSQNGYLCDPDDWNTLADRMLDLTDEDKQQSMGKNSFKIVTSKYAIENTKNEYMKIYAEIRSES